MERLACVDFPHLALQILLERRPEWREHSVVLLDKDSPQGVILQVNRRARESRILPGMRYAAGLSLDHDLRAGTVERSEVAQTVEDLRRLLFDFSPQIEPREDEPGVFWLRVTGFDALFGSFEAWGKSLYTRLREEGFYASIVVGFTRCGTYAVARTRRPGALVLRDPQHEHETAHAVDIEHLPVPAKVRDTLRALGVRTLGQFLGLPADGIRPRFGKEAEALRRFAAGEDDLPLQPIPYEEPVRRRLDFDEPELDRNRLIFRIKAALHGLLMELATRHCDLRELAMQFRLEDGDEVEASARPAAPTLDETKILELVRLRLENTVLTSGIIDGELTALGVESRRTQTHLFRDHVRRDLQAASHAIARLRAEFGEDAVVRVVLRPEHVPEAQYTFEPLDTMPRAHPREVERSLVRRLYMRPQPLPRFVREITPGWMIRGLDAGSLTRTLGPYVVSGNWWQRKLFREYYFACARRGDIFWVYWDHRRQQWFLHGTVE